MKRILFVSIAFPPKNDPECIQAGRYFKYLSADSSSPVDVVTSSSPTLFMPPDEGLMKYDRGYRQKLEIRLFEGKFVNYLLRKSGLGSLLFPDSKMTFHWQWQKAARRLKVKPDIIYSRSNPMSSAIMAMKLKRHFNVPWVMHLSDPWAISPLENFPAEHRFRKMEQTLLTEAQAITVTSTLTKQLYTENYPSLAHKFTILPNVYDPDEVRPFEMNNDNTKLRVVYTGGLSGKRDVVFLQDILEIIRNHDSGFLDKIEFIFAGEADRQNRSFFRTCHPSIHHMGPVGYEKSRSLCESAHILLTVDNPTPGTQAVFFPSKLLDYFLFQRMIWAVTPEGSTTRKILESYNSRLFTREEKKAMAEFLMSSVKTLHEMGSTAFRAGGIPPGYDARENATHLKELLLSLH